MSEAEKSNSLPLLSIDHLSYSYHTLAGEIKALHQVSLKVNKGDFLAIVGPSGCGKSTLFSLIAGLLTPEEGSICFSENLSDENKTDNPESLLRVGYMLQQDQLFDWLTIYENVTLPLRIQKCKDPSLYERIERLLQEYGLADFYKKYPHELSGGMRQRAALIRTLAPNPQLLLLDEPFSALDYQTRLFVSTDICNSIRKEGKTAILITHDISEAIHLSDRVIVMSARPSCVLTELSIQLSHNDNLTFSSSPEYAGYFKIIWEALQNHEIHSS